ncbi:MAG: hypothetical protein Q9168_004907 [Polycauliona sp. 1 TL-2023]
MESTSPILKLPGEIRNKIYLLLLSPKHVELKSVPCRQAPTNHEQTDRKEHWYNFQVSILRANCQIHDEASAIFRKENTFIIIRFQASRLPHAFAPARTLPPYFQMYQQVAASITLRSSTNVENEDGSFVERLYALQDLETTIPYDLVVYECCTTGPTYLHIHSYTLENKPLDFLAHAPFKAALQVLCLDGKITLTHDATGRTSNIPSQDILSMSQTDQLDGTHLLQYLRIMLAIETQLMTHPDRGLTHKMFTDFLTHVIHILSREHPLGVENPHTFWTFVVDGIFALGTLNRPPHRMDDRIFLLMCTLHSANLLFKYLWQTTLDARLRVYLAWTTALQAFSASPTSADEEHSADETQNSANDEHSPLERAEKALQALQPIVALQNHGLDLTEITAAMEMDKETFAMPRNPCWIARLTRRELERMEFPFEAARRAE